MTAKRNGRSPGFRGIASKALSRAALDRWNAKHANRAKCGAKRKRDGLPCEQPAMENGRCHLHGGKTPKGDNWHRPVWPDKSASRPERKLKRKLADLKRAADERAARIAAMTPEELARYKKWHAVRKIGSAAERARLRTERKAAAEFRASVASRSASDNPELVALRVSIVEMEFEAERLRGILTSTAEDDANEAKGVFG